MFFKMKTTLILVTLIFTSFGISVNFAQTNLESDKIRNKVNKYGVGKKVKLKLKDGTKFKGKISKIENQNFTVTNQKLNDTKTFNFNDVRQIKKSSYSKWIIVGVATAVAVAIIIPLSKRCRNEGRNNLCL